MLFISVDQRAVSGTRTTFTRRGLVWLFGERSEPKCASLAWKTAVLEHPHLAAAGTLRALRPLGLSLAPRGESFHSGAALRLGLVCWGRRNNDARNLFHSRPAARPSGSCVLGLERFVGVFMLAARRLRLACWLALLEPFVFSGRRPAGGPLRARTVCSSLRLACWLALLELYARSLSSHVLAAILGSN